MRLPMKPAVVIEEGMKIYTEHDTTRNKNNLKVTCGFRPKKIVWTSTLYNMCIYYDEDNVDIGEGKFIRIYANTQYVDTIGSGSSVAGLINSIDDDGFTIKNYSDVTWTHFHCIAIG